MKISSFEQRAVGYYKARIAVHLKGKIGRGKSSVIEALPARLAAALGGRYGMVIINAALLTPPDAIGYNLPQKVGEWLESVFTAPYFWRTLEGKRLEEYDGGIIFIDERDKADPDIKKILGESQLSGRFGPHRVPPGWIVWSAGNHPDERSGSTKEYDHLINRCMEVVLDDDVDTSIDWMEKNGVHPVGLAFAKEHPQVLFMEPPKTQGPWCTPRSFVECFAYLTSLSEDGLTLPSDPLTMEECAGKIGASAIAQLSAKIRLQYEIPQLDEIVAHPKSCLLPEAPDAQMLICYSLAYRADKANVDPIMTYIQRMPAEFAIVFGKSAVHRNRELINTPSFGKWCRENSSLMLAIAEIK